MFVILSYDVPAKRDQKYLRLCRKYLIHEHNSVFDGEITETKLEELKLDLSEIFSPEDTIMIYALPSKTYLKQYVIGITEKDFLAF